MVPDLSRVTLGAIFDPLERGERCEYVAILYIMILYYNIFYHDILLMFITDSILLILYCCNQCFVLRARQAVWDMLVIVCVCVCLCLCLCLCLCARARVLLMHIADVVVIFFSLRAILGPLDSGLERGERCGF